MVKHTASPRLQKPRARGEGSTLGGLWLQKRGVGGSEAWRPPGGMGAVMVHGVGRAGACAARVSPVGTSSRFLSLLCRQHLPMCR